MWLSGRISLKTIGPNSASAATSIEDDRNPRVDEDRRIALADRKRAAELLLGERAEDQPDDDRRDRIAEAAQRIAEQAEEEQHAELDQRRVGADRAERRENRMPA